MFVVAESSTWQAAAPVAGAALVLLGVILTLRQNARRLKNEQLERRAKDRQAALQEQYGKFAASCLEYFAINQTKAGISNDHEYVSEVAEIDAEERAQALVRLNERGEKARYRAWDIYASMAGAFARLLLLETDHERLKQVDKLFREIGAIRPYHDQLGIASTAANLEGFMRSTGIALEGRYRAEAELAGRGLHPATPPPHPARTDSDRGG